MSEIKVIINGQECVGQAGDTILKIAENNGIHIPTLCHHESVKKYGACGLCVVEAENVPKLLRSCSSTASDGMVINTNSERVLQARKVSLELLMSDHEGDCVGPCSLNCPAGTNCQGYVKQIALGNDLEAVKIIKEKLPFPSSIGRVCPHPCEKACRRNHVEEPISIAFLKYFAGDNVRKAGGYVPEKAKATGKKVGIIGGGPAGLTAAYFLALKGHEVTVTDAMPKMGGMLRYGIPEYRLPKAVLDAEIAEIASLGIKLENNVKLGKDISFEEYKAQYDAVLIAVGAWQSSGVGCPGEDLEGVLGGIDFLRAAQLKTDCGMGKNVAVVGGGNTAMDACRTAVRLGAEHVYVIYRRTRAEMPAEDIEIEEAMEEGVEFKFLTNPAEIQGENGHVTAVKLQVMELGEADASGRRKPVPVEGKFETLKVDNVIAAIGQRLNPAGLEAVELTKRGTIAADEATFRTSVEGVFAVGDATNKGAGIAIAAIGEANKAAGIIDAYLNGVDAAYHKPFVSEREVTPEMFADREKQARVKMPHRSPEERKHDFLEVNLGLPEDEARAEAKRCLECGCHDYGNCKLIQCANEQPINPERLKGSKHQAFKEQRLVSIERDQGKCIMCALCVRTCEENAKKGILGLIGRGFDTVVKPEFRDESVIAGCADCHQCADVCPTGALKILK
ncbi:MAG: FAD-dependent oxidoreductase [Lachnospiraceae bacterium]|jgi:formate dehydrogenase major subunit